MLNAPVFLLRQSAQRIGGGAFFVKSAVRVVHGLRWVATQGVLKIAPVTAQQVGPVEVGGQIYLRREHVIEAPLVETQPAAVLPPAILNRDGVGVVVIDRRPVATRVAPARHGQVVVLTEVVLVDEQIVKIRRGFQILHLASFGVRRVGCDTPATARRSEN